METKEKEKEMFESIRDKVLAGWDKGNLVYADIGGLESIKFEDFIKQPLDGMLYDINRDAATILTFIEDLKWVNDFALTKLLEYYYNKCKEYKNPRLNDNEVREVARMQQMIDTYESFIMTLLLMTRSKKDITVPIFTDTNLDKEMGCIWKWVKEHKDKE